MWSKKTIVSVAIVAVASFIIGCYAASVTISAQGNIFLAIGDDLTNGCDNSFQPNTFDAAGTPTPGTAVAKNSMWTCDQAYVDANGANAAKLPANIMKDPTNNEDHILVSTFKCKTADTADSHILCKKAAAGTTGGTTGGTSSGATSTLSFAVIATSVLSFFALA